MTILGACGVFLLGSDSLDELVLLWVEVLLFAFFTLNSNERSIVS
jgi:hypothetical protein